MTSPDRLREIALEMAREVLNYIQSTLKGEGVGMLSQVTIEQHAAEFFDLPPAEMDRLGRCLQSCVVDLLRYTGDVVIQHPDVAVSFLCASFHLHLKTHGVKEREVKPAEWQG